MKLYYKKYHILLILIFIYFLPYVLLHGIIVRINFKCILSMIKNIINSRILYFLLLQVL